MCFSQTNENTIFRKITLVTHPDRLQNLNLDPIQIIEREKLYHRAVTAIEDQDAASLLEIADFLNLDFDDVELAQHLPALDAALKKMSEELGRAQGEFAWIWGESFGDIDRRVKLLILVCQRYEWKPPVRSSLEKLILKIESDPSRAPFRPVGTKPPRRK